MGKMGEERRRDDMKIFVFGHLVEICYYSRQGTEWRIGLKLNEAFIFENSESEMLVAELKYISKGNWDMDPVLTFNHF